MNAKRVRELVDALNRETEAAAASREPQRGMQVPYHGSFASAVPSVIRDLRWYVRELRAALDSDPPIPRRYEMCQCGCGASLAGKNAQAKYVSEPHLRRAKRARRSA